MTLAIVDAAPPEIVPPRPLLIVDNGENSAEAARQAGLAEDHADAAAADAAAARAAVGQAPAADTAAGLGATSEGGTFWVDQGDGTGKVYRHDAGPTATEIGRFIKDITDDGAAALIGTAGGHKLEKVLLGSVSLTAMTAATAAALKTLAEANDVLTGYAGEAHEIEQTAFIVANDLRLIGNGATLRNTNATKPGPTGSDYVNNVLAIGVSKKTETDDLVFDTPTSVTGRTFNLSGGAEADYAAGAPVVIWGSTLDNDGLPLHAMRARAESTAAGSVTIDRNLSILLAADSPKIAVGVQPGVTSSTWAGGYYIVAGWEVGHWRFEAENGALRFGGLVDGHLHDLVIDARMGPSLNALQDTLVENIIVFGWREVCEIAESSRGATIRGIRATLASPAGRMANGTDDAGNSLMSIGEMSVDCAIEDVQVQAANGYDYRAKPTTGFSIGRARSCVGRNTHIEATTLATAFQCSSAAGAAAGDAIAPTEDCGFENVSARVGTCNRYFALIPGGLGPGGELNAPLRRAFMLGGKFYGTVTAVAGQVGGERSIVRNNWCENGACGLTTGATSCIIEGNYFPGGFSGLTQTLLNRNTIRNNESDASRRIETAAVLDVANTSHAASAANSISYTMTIAALDLAALDEVHFKIEGVTAGGGSGARNVRVTLDCSAAGAGAATEIALMSSTVTATSFDLEGRIEIFSNALIHAHAKTRTGTASAVVDTYLTGQDLNTNGLVIRVEIWSVSGSVTTRSVKVAGQKAGMRNVPVFA